MINLVLSFAAGVLVAVAIRLAGFALWAGVVPGTIVFLGAYVFLARRIAMKLQALSKAAEKELSAQPTNQRERQQRLEKAIKILEEGLGYDRWQFLIGAEVHAQIGMIHYVSKNYDAAQQHFAKASPRNYMALAMRG